MRTGEPPPHPPKACNHVMSGVAFLIWQPSPFHSLPFPDRTHCAHTLSTCTATCSSAGDMTQIAAATP